MKTGLSHLPENCQEALRDIAERIREAVPAEMTVLLGSYARGGGGEVPGKRGK